MQIETLKLTDLKPAPYNPRKKLKPGDAEFEKLKRSIEEYGFAEPIIVNKRTGNIVGGHQRAEVLKTLGYTEIECVIVDLDEQKEKAFNIALNKINGEWDETLLTDLLKDLENSGFDLELTGFDITEVKELYGSGSLENAHEDEFDAEAEAEKIVNPVTKQGDIWYLGKHRLMCGDCTKADEVAKLMAGTKADMCLCDPPYNIAYEGAAGKIQNDDMSDKDFYEFLLAFYKVAYGVLKGGAPLYVFHSTKESVNFITAMKNAGFKVAQTLVWVKNHFTLGRQDYQWIHEPILYGWKEADGGHYFIDDRTLQTVFEDCPKDIAKLTKEELRSLLTKIYNLQTDTVRADKPTKSIDHPTMKPVVLCAKLIFNSSREGETVYEPFSGGGSTLIACGQLNRICYASEIDGKFVDSTVKRFANEFPDEPIKLIRNGKEASADEWAALLEN